MFPWRRKSKLERRLRAFARGERGLAGLLQFEDDPLRQFRLDIALAVETRGEARALVAGVRRMENLEIVPGSEEHRAAKRMLELFQNPTNEVVERVFVDEGLPELFRLFDESVATDSDPQLLLVIVRVFSLSGTLEGRERIRLAARRPVGPESWAWSKIMDADALGRDNGRWLCRQLSGPLPSGRVATALLGLANALALEGDLDPHPFDSAEGQSLLERWLRDPEASEAVRATAVLPFLSASYREPLLRLVMDHPDPWVRLEGAWAAAKSGVPEGLTRLARFCEDRAYTARAREYLEELGRQDAIPQRARDPAFIALAEMCDWLASEFEMGRPPDEIEVADTREIHWPPTGDRRRLWVFRYVYRGQGDEPDRVGLSMTGGKTPWSFFERLPPDAPLLDVYALHCSWEFVARPLGGLRHHEGYSVEHGRALLLERNTGLDASLEGGAAAK